MPNLTAPIHAVALWKCRLLIVSARDHMNAFLLWRTVGCLRVASPMVGVLCVYSERYKAVCFSLNVVHMRLLLGPTKREISRKRCVCCISVFQGTGNSRQSTRTLLELNNMALSLFVVTVWFLVRIFVRLFYVTHHHPVQLLKLVFMWRRAHSFLLLPGCGHSGWRLPQHLGPTPLRY